MDYRKYKLSRRSLLEQVSEDCLREMYAKAQPSMDYDAIIARNKELLKNGAKKQDLPKDYEHCYLSQEECRYIFNKYIVAYKVVSDVETSVDEKNQKIIFNFDSDVDLLIKDLKEGYPKDKWIPEHTDEYGIYHGGYRGYEHVPPMKEIIGEENTQKFIEFLEDRKDFYKFDKTEYNGLAWIYMYSPHSDLNFVQKQYPDLVIDPRHLTENEFWMEEEYGYISDDDDIE